MADLPSGEDSPRSHVGRLVAGTVSMVRRWGVYVDLGLEYPGYIDPIFIRDDLYEVGDRVKAYIDDFRERSRVYELRPEGNASLRERLARRESEGRGS